MIQLILVRHGEREHKRSDQDDHLIGLAKQQAEELGQRFRAFCDLPSLVLTSSYQHARQTSENITRGLGLEASCIREAMALTPSSQA